MMRLHFYSPTVNASAGAYRPMSHFRHASCDSFLKSPPASPQTAPNGNPSSYEVEQNGTRWNTFRQHPLSRAGCCLPIIALLLPRPQSASLNYAMTGMNKRCEATMTQSFIATFKT